MVVYVATTDGWNQGYGSQIFLLGVFDSEEKAKSTGGLVTKVNLNEMYPTKEDEHGNYYNSFCIGGYIE